MTLNSEIYSKIKMARNKSNPKRSTNNSRGSKKTKPNKKNTVAPAPSFSLSNFLGTLFTSAFFALYGVVTKTAFDKNGLSPGFKAFNTQVLARNGIAVEQEVLGKINLVFAYIFIAAPYLNGVKIFKRTVLLFAFLVLEWVTVQKAYEGILNVAQTQNWELLIPGPQTWPTFGLFLVTLGIILN